MEAKFRKALITVNVPIKLLNLIMIRIAILLIACAAWILGLSLGRRLLIRCQVHYTPIIVKFPRLIFFDLQKLNFSLICAFRKINTSQVSHQCPVLVHQVELFKFGSYKQVCALDPITGRVEGSLLDRHSKIYKRVGQI